MISTEKPGSPEEMLEHFGTKGMKWGVRKAVDKSIGTKTAGKKPTLFPATQAGINAKGTRAGVKAFRSTRRENRAKKYDALANKAQAEIDKINANPSRFRFNQHMRMNHARELAKFRDDRRKDAKDIREGRLGLTKRDKTILIGAGATAAVVATYSTYKYIDSGGAHRLLTKSQPLKRNEALSRKMSADEIMNEVVKPINPGFEKEIGTTMNCRRCTTGYIMRRRGYDVKATNTYAGTGQHPLSILNVTDPDVPEGRFKSAYAYMKETMDLAKNPDKDVGPLTTFMNKSNWGKDPISDANFHNLTPTLKANTIFDSLSKNPEGAMGELGMQWSMGGGHSMAWEIIGGKPVIFDTQSGKSYTQDTGLPSSQSLEFIKLAGRMNDVAQTRLDNVPLNEMFLRKWVRNVK